MATPSVILKTVLLLASALKVCHGQQCNRGDRQVGIYCIFDHKSCGFYTCSWNERCFTFENGKWCGYCVAGYQFVGATNQCEDINECEQYSWLCSNGQCANNPGSYTCTCWNGYQKNDAGVCTDINECQQSPWLCSNGQCSNNPGSYTCTCWNGYQKNAAGVCTDIDECQQNPCQNGYCTNDPGSYTCTCWRGYQKHSSSVCTDIDECQQNPCQNGYCTSDPGSYTCTCWNGYQKDDAGFCTDIDECASSPCHHGSCQNTEGSFLCNCSVGFTGKLCNLETADLYINSTMPPNATGERLKAIFSSEEWYLGPNITWTCTVEATDCSTVNVTVSLNITNSWEYGLSYFSLPDGERLGRYRDDFKQATYTSPFDVELHRVQRSILQLAYITVSANSSLTMVCGRHTSAFTPTDACNHCQSSPCAGNMICLDVRDGFLCQCPEGFINTFDSNPCLQRPDLVLDTQTLQQTSGREVRAMFSASASASGQSQNWTCAVESTNCSMQDVTLQADVSSKDKVSSVISVLGDVTLENPGNHFLAARAPTPVHFRVNTALSVYVVVRAPRSLTVTCSRNSPASLPVMHCAKTSGKDELSSSSVPTYAIVGGVAALIIIVIIVIAIVIIKRKRKAAEGNGKTDTHVSFSGLKSRDGQPENSSTAGAPDGTPLYQNQRPLPSRLTSDTRTASAQGATRSTNARRGNQSGIAAPDVPAPRQTSRPMSASGEAPYSHLGEADRANDHGYEDLTTHPRRDVTDGGYEAVQTRSLCLDDVNDDAAAEGGYSCIHPDQVEGQEGQGSCYERVDMDYANNAFSK